MALPCGCTADLRHRDRQSVGTLRNPWTAKLCRLHRAAFDLLDALRALTHPRAGEDAQCHIGICREAVCLNCRDHAAGRAAIKKATGQGEGAPFKVGREGAERLVIGLLARHAREGATVVHFGSLVDSEVEMTLETAIYLAAGDDVPHHVEAR